jgi:hypothetical protein
VDEVALSFTKSLGASARIARTIGSSSIICFRMSLR